MLVILIIIGVLFAIAAPGWDAFLNNQRLTGARELVVQSLKQAQTKAKTSKTAQIVGFRYENGFPEVSSGVYLLTNPASSLNNWQRLGENRLPSNTVEVTTSRTAAPNLPADSIVFDAEGAVAQYPLVPAQEIQNAGDEGKEAYLRVTLRNPNASNPAASQRCVKVKTLLGALQLDERDKCN